MKIFEIIRHSRILKTGLTAIFAILIILFGLLWALYGDHPVNKKAISQFAEIVVPFGEYEEIYVVDGPAGVFLAKEEKGDTLKLLNTDGSIIADMAPLTDFVQQRGNLLMLHYMSDNPDVWRGQWRLFYPVVNYNQLVAGETLADTNVVTSEIHPSGQYYFWREENSSRRGISTADGEILYESDENLSYKLLCSEGIVMITDYSGSTEQTELLNIYTDEMIDTKGHDVIDGNGYLWICEGKNPLRQDERYVVGADFEELEEDFTGEDLTFSDDGKYLFGQMCVPSADGKRVESVSFVADAQGNIIYKEKPRHYFQYGAEGDIEFVDIVGGKLLRRHYLAEDKIQCDYIDLVTLEQKDFGGQSVFSAMDFDDGIILSAASTGENEEFNGEHLGRYEFDYIYITKDSHYFLEYDWYFVNENGEAYDFAFEGAYPSKDGYAAVRSEKKWGVIMFQDAV